jgi:2-methylaconitate cis-trans-isomerase PrpF
LKVEVLPDHAVETPARSCRCPCRPTLPPDAGEDSVSILQNSGPGTFTATVVLEGDPQHPTVRRAGIVRTARKLMDGVVFPRPA